MGGVEIYRADAAFEADGKTYGAGTFVIPMTQVFARYAKDMLEKQTYPEVRRGPNAPPEPPYDVTAWSLGMLLGVDTVFVKNALPAVKMTKVEGLPKVAGDVTGTGTRFAFDYKGADSAIAINRLLKDGARVSFDGPSHVAVSGIPRPKIAQVAKEYGLNVRASEVRSQKSEVRMDSVPFHAPRVAMYQPWTGGNMDEGWTRWVLEQYEFNLTSIHNADIRAGKLRQKFDTIIIADQNPRDIIDGFDAPAIRPEYRGGIGEAGLNNLTQFVADGGTLVTMGNACDLAIEKLPIPVRNLKKGLTRDQHFAPGAILKLEVDTQHPLGYGVASDTYGFYINSPFFSIVEGFASQKTSVVARYSEHQRDRVGLAEGRGADGGPRRRRLDRHEPGQGRAVRPAPAAPRADARDVPDAVQRAVPVGARRQHNRGRRPRSNRFIFESHEARSQTRSFRVFVSSWLINRDSHLRHRRHVRQGIQRADRHARVQGHASARDAAARPLPGRRVERAR